MVMSLIFRTWTTALFSVIRGSWLHTSVCWTCVTTRLPGGRRQRRIYSTTRMQSEWKSRDGPTRFACWHHRAPRMRHSRPFQSGGGGAAAETRCYPSHANEDDNLPRLPDRACRQPSSLRHRQDQPRLASTWRCGMALENFDDSSRETMDRLSLGRPTEGPKQATLVAAVGGFGLQTTPIITRPENLTTSLQTGLTMRGMAAAAWVSSVRSFGTRA